jgi:methylase of polypeptide subunit release factors
MPEAMPLCDLSHLGRFDIDSARAFLQCLSRTGVTRDALHPVSKLCEWLPDPLRNPARRWHLRRIGSPLGPIMRAFFFADPVAADELRRAIANDRLFETLVEVGLLVTEAGGVVCPLRLNLANELFIFADDLTLGGEAVMGAGATTGGLIQAAWPAKRLASVLDWGCGAGTAALLMAEVADRSVGVDISPRALTISRLNALLAGAENVEFLVSDMFSGVKGQQFDLIVAQPPFVSCPTGADSITFLYGGARGDELVLRLMEQIPSHLAPGGRAVLLVDWPTYDDVSPTDRIRRTIRDAAVDLLVLLSTTKDLDEHVTYYGSMMHPTLGADFERYVLTHREHLERMKIRELRLALIVLRRSERPPWTRLIKTRPLAQVEPTGAQVDRMIVVQDLLAAGSDAILSASLVIPPDTKFVEQDANSVRVELPGSRLVAPVVTSRAGADLLVEVDRAATVADAVEALMQRLPQLRQGGVAPVLNGVRDALESGLLEVGEQQIQSQPG